MIPPIVEYLILPVMPNGQICVWEFNMEQHDVTPLFHLGSAIGSLLKAIEHSDHDNPIWSAASAKREFEKYIRIYEGYNKLALSLKAAGKVIIFLEEYIQQRQTNKVVNQLSAISEIDLTKEILRNAINDFQTLIEAEIPQLNIFYVTPHRCYDMTMLINEGENLLSLNTLNMLGGCKQEVVNDIREATKALAFGSYTAVGFHLYRAIEAIVKEYFIPLGLNVTEIMENNPNLGTYLKILKGIHGKFIVTTPVDVKVTSFLEHIVKEYRNPIMHPQETWDVHKANRAIGPAISLIEMMVEDIQDIKKKTP